jgi:Nif-specific regulatory protein
MPSISFANQLFAAIERSRTIEQLLQEPLSWMLANSHWSTIWVMSPSKGAWKKILAIGKPVTQAPDQAFLAECLDSRKHQSSSTWNLYCLGVGVDLVLCVTNPVVASNTPDSQESFREQLGLLAQAVELWNRQHRKTRDVVRLSQILEVAANWHSHQDLDRLLQDIAQAATRLLRSDRASIFLWDKQSRELVGHPATNRG